MGEEREKLKKYRLNRTSTSIGWSPESVNPLGWGCYGPNGTPEKPNPCWYCYAKEYARRGVRAGKFEGCVCHEFIPHWHPEQLEYLYFWRKKARIVSVQTMGDLFHPYTPEEHILKTIEACYDNKKHVYQFTTRNPSRIQEILQIWRRKQGKDGLNPPQNWWFGTTVTCQDEAHLVLQLPENVNRFVSFEPLRGYVDLKQNQVEYIDWAIIGGFSAMANRDPDTQSWKRFIYEQVKRIPCYVNKNIHESEDELPQKRPELMLAHTRKEIAKEFLL